MFLFILDLIRIDLALTYFHSQWKIKDYVILVRTLFVEMFEIFNFLKFYVLFIFRKFIYLIFLGILYFYIFLKFKYLNSETFFQIKFMTQQSFGNLIELFKSKVQENNI